MTSYFPPSAIASSLAALALLATPAAAAPGTEELLTRLAANATAFWEQFSAVTCTESVVQRKLEPNGKEILRRKSDYDYLILLQLAGDELMVEESRILQGKAAKETDRALLATNGFSTLLLVFHPLFQPSFAFGPVEEEASGNGTRWRLTFRFRDGHRSPSVLQLRARDYPIPWEGTAWIDPATGAIGRIEAHLRAPMEDVGLQTLSSDVTYAPVAFRGAPAGVWLPKTARIEAATKRQRWQNVHEFARYRQFNVDTDATVAAPTIPAEGAK